MKHEPIGTFSIGNIFNSKNVKNEVFKTIFTLNKNYKNNGTYRKYRYELRL